jgi:copper chaperone CopZ
MAIEILDLPVRGMTCGNCARSVEQTLASTPGVTKVSVELESGRAAIEYDPSLVTREVLVNAVRELGYEVAA